MTVVIFAVYVVAVPLQALFAFAVSFAALLLLLSPAGPLLVCLPALGAPEGVDFLPALVAATTGGCQRTLLFFKVVGLTGIKLIGRSRV